jgi:hypothetical protein
MLTIFAVPKVFRGHTAIIQKNAITSWTLLRPRPQILLFGIESGTEETCSELGLQHIPEVGCGVFGVPLLRDLFLKAQRLAQEDLLCYVNSDIMLLSDFSIAALGASKISNKFLMVGRRWDIFLDRLWDFESDQAQQALREYVLRDGKQGPLPGNSDFFLFSRDLWSDIPDLVIGRGFWDAWLIYEARRLGAAVVDASSAVMAIHQTHDQSSYPHGLRQWRAELDLNREIAGEEPSRFCLYDSTHLLTPSGFQRPKGLSYLIRRVDTLPLFHPRLAGFAQIPRVLISRARAVKRNRALAREPVARLAKLICSKLPKSGITCILGLVHSPGNGHAEKTQGLQLAHSLVWGGFPVVVYDPRPSVMEKARKMLGGPVEFALSAEECIRQGDVIVVTVPCLEFTQVLVHILAANTSTPFVIDCCGLFGRNADTEGIRYLRWEQD